LLFAESGGLAPPGLLLRRAVRSPVVGPARGWEASELETAQRARFLATGLGPRILRAETAAIAAVTAPQLLWGDLRAL